MIFVSRVLLTAALAACTPLAAHASGGGGLGHELPWWTVLPFVGLLLSIALIPMLAEHFWHSHLNQVLVAAAWSVPVVAGLVWLGVAGEGPVGQHAMRGLGHALGEYVSFMALIGSLYVISGGILLRGDLRATPAVNTGFLAVGAVVANLVGTTGASMLLIRPILRTNGTRTRRWHLPVFFIFVVSNVGGALTPIGDPPLFIGYLRGVPFFWTATALWPAWLFTVGALLAMFLVVDTIQARGEPPSAVAADRATVVPLSIDGKFNLFLLGGVIAAVLLLSPEPGADDVRSYYLREVAMVLLAGASVWWTPAALRAANGFDYAPILEVAALFAGIFVVMVPATALLEAHGHTLALTEPWHYFWATGILSAFLDNAPTYAAFTAIACGASEVCTSAEQLGTLTTDPVSASRLAAISAGAVFFGAGSYIGNGPNFMVRAIAVQSGYPMPSFFAYCGWAVVFLGPVFLLLTLFWLI